MIPISTVRAEPNLVPLLDVVMQLLMFFMMCVNFVTEQFNRDIQLPVAQSARPPSRTQNQSDVLVLNLNRVGELILGNGEKKKNRDEIALYLRTTFSDTRRELQLRAESKGQSGPVEVKTVIIVRADRAVDYEAVYQLMQLCKEAGYRKLQIRALSKV